MTSAPVDTTVDRDANIIHEEADRQLQQALEYTCSSSDVNLVGLTSLSRKHRRTFSNATFESEYLSEVSGQFDDADEPDPPLREPPSIPAAVASNNNSPSSHSVKRRRSNDWPRRSPAVTDDEWTSRREPSSGPRHRWPFHHYGKQSGSAHGSPRSPRYAVRPARRSRFVEGHMNDSVSEKPPSIFLRDEARAADAAAGITNRPSGIFRFGKAIASAFNPFGGWGNVSDIWRGSQDGTSQAQTVADDHLRQAERAYEELKRSGYKGTVKGSYMQSLRAGEGELPEQTWKSIQEKMEYTGGYHSRESPSHGQDPGGLLRSPFHDLRKAKSSLGIPSVKRSDGQGQEVRHQKSRKELQRQAKLLKRVSDLEDKLQRARRELRELAGDEDLLVRANHGERSYQKRFVPGALPSLPSERLLHNEPVAPISELPAPLSPLPESNNASGMTTEGPCQDPEHGNGKRRVTPKPRRDPSSHSQTRRPSDSPSRKRKPADPKTHQPVLQPEPNVHSSPCNQDPTPATPVPETDEAGSASVSNTPDQPPSSRRAKLPKTARGDSPGSVERKQTRGHQHASSPAAEDRASRPSQRALRSTNLRNRSATPVLRMKKGRADLRSASGTAPNSPALDENKENQQDGDDGQRKENGIDGLDDPEQPTPSPTPGRRKARYDYIPPVPPLPKDLAATAAKVDRRLAREMEKRRGVQTGRRRVGEEGFQWPEDIF